MGSFVSRPDDLQTLSLPLSLVAVVGYLTAIVALSGGGGSWVKLASFLPPFSPFVMLARVMVTAVPTRGGALFHRAFGGGVLGGGGGPASGYAGRVAGFWARAGGWVVCPPARRGGG